MKTKIAFLALFLFLVNPLLMADIITLTNGQTIEGESKEVGDNVEIITNTSRMTIPKNRIAVVRIFLKRFFIKRQGGLNLAFMIEFLRLFKSGFPFAVR